MSYTKRTKPLQPTRESSPFTQGKRQTFAKEGSLFTSFFEVGLHDASDLLLALAGVGDPVEFLHVQEERPRTLSVVLL